MTISFSELLCHCPHCSRCQHLYSVPRATLWVSVWFVCGDSLTQLISNAIQIKWPSKGKDERSHYLYQKGQNWILQPKWKSNQNQFEWMAGTVLKKKKNEFTHLKLQWRFIFDVGYLKTAFRKSLKTLWVVPWPRLQTHSLGLLKTWSWIILIN